MQHCNQSVVCVPSGSKDHSTSPRFARASLGLRMNGRIANIYSVHANPRPSFASLSPCLSLRVNGRIANIYSVHASLRLSLASLG